jgi:hypothetical protein
MRALWQVTKNALQQFFLLTGQLKLPLLNDSLHPYIPFHSLIAPRGGGGLERNSGGRNLASEVQEIEHGNPLSL